MKTQREKRVFAAGRLGPASTDSVPMVRRDDYERMEAENSNLRAEGERWSRIAFIVALYSDRPTPLHIELSIRQTAQHADVTAAEEREVYLAAADLVRKAHEHSSRNGERVYQELRELREQQGGNDAS